MLEHILLTFQGQNSIFSNLKQPWEIAFDICSYMMALSSSFFYIHFWFIESKIYCVPSIASNETWPTPLNNYVSSRCRAQRQIALLVYFPFCSLFTLIVMFTTHNIWKQFPSVNRKIRIFCNICEQIKSIENYVDIVKKESQNKVSLQEEKSDRIHVINCPSSNFNISLFNSN